MQLLKNIKSRKDLIKLIHEWHNSKLITNRIIGFQFSIPLKDYKLPFVCKEDCSPIVLDLIKDIKHNGSQNELITYHKQWRHFGGHLDKDKGVDQISNVITILKKKKVDRRLLIVAWNPHDTKISPLTQCLLQFYVENGRLSCKLYQSSGYINQVFHHDSGKIVLFTYMLCHVTGLKPGSLIHSFGQLEYDMKLFNDEMIDDNHVVTVHLCDNCKNIDDFTQQHFHFDCHYNNEMENDLLLTYWNICGEGRLEGRHEEIQYLDLLNNIITNGNKLADRTGVGTMSIFGPQMVFSLHDNVLPLLTTKRVFYRAIIEELLWFLRGSTDGNELSKKNIRIWDANGSKEFLESVGLGHRQAGDLGPIYGFQWRHFGAKYIDMLTDYTGKGVDQITNVIESIKNYPCDKNLVVMAWNPRDVGLMALPPCHCLMQFFVDKGELSCKLYLRSGDMGLGVPFNIASYALLTHMIAHVTRLRPGYLVYTLGDAHVYLNHIEALSEQIKREPRPFPKITFKRSVLTIEEFQVDDFVVQNYDPHPKIVMEMAV